MTALHISQIFSPCPVPPPFLIFLPLLLLSFLSPSLCNVQSGLLLSPNNPPKHHFKTQTNTHTSYLPSPLIRRHERVASTASPLPLTPLPGTPAAIPPWDRSEVKAGAEQNRQNQTYVLEPRQDRSTARFCCPFRLAVCKKMWRPDDARRAPAAANEVWAGVQEHTTG